MNQSKQNVSTENKKDPELQITTVAISDLQLDPLNPRSHDDRQIQKLAKSIKQFGFISPVLIDEQLRVIAGHGRIAALKYLRHRTVRAISINHLSEAQRRAFMIADNRMAELASWNEQLLGEHFKALSEVDLNFDLDATGFEVAEIDLLIEGLSPATDAESDPADEIPEAVEIRVSKQNDLWLLGPHRMLCADSRDRCTYLQLMSGRKAQVVFTDPPYNVKIDGHAGGLGTTKHKNFQMAFGEMQESEFTDFLARAFSHLAAHSVAGSLHYVFMDWRHAKEILTAGNESYSELKSLCVWVKDNGGMGSLYRSQHELVFVFKNGRESHRNNIQLGQFGRYRTNVWNYPGVNSFSRSTEEGNLLEFHPTVKPVALVADAIMDCSARSDIVLDPFLGSGTTVIAAERTGRVCYGIELEPVYIDTVIRRWERFTGRIATHARSGRTFKELEREAANEQQQ